MHVHADNDEGHRGNLKGSSTNVGYSRHTLTLNTQHYMLVLHACIGWPNGLCLHEVSMVSEVTPKSLVKFEGGE